SMNGGSDDVGKVHLQVSSENQIHYGFGMHEDIVIASVYAYLDALKKILSQ
ncbi:MAG: hypothetical protein HC880_15805, partial [Bacteroidia bacterium]|nr:hypothetical protein [Bacteroidia bacterium]